jgi:hypothetical protein
MKRNKYWLAAALLSLIWTDTVCAESIPAADSIKNTVERTLRAYREEDIDAMVSTVHSQAPSYLSIKKDSPTVFENYDINAELISFTFIGQMETMRLHEQRSDTRKYLVPPFKTPSSIHFQSIAKKTTNGKHGMVA